MPVPKAREHCGIKPRGDLACGLNRSHRRLRHQNFQLFRMLTADVVLPRATAGDERMRRYTPGFAVFNINDILAAYLRIEWVSAATCRDDGLRCFTDWFQFSRGIVVITPIRVDERSVPGVAVHLHFKASIDRRNRTIRRNAAEVKIEWRAGRHGRLRGMNADVIRQAVDIDGTRGVDGPATGFGDGTEERHLPWPGE